MDDGSTVATRLRELLRLKQIAVEHSEQLLELENKDAQISAQSAQIAKLEARLRAQAQLNEQHNDSNAQANAGGGSSGAGS